MFDGQLYVNGVYNETLFDPTPTVAGATCAVQAGSIDLGGPTTTLNSGVVSTAALFKKTNSNWL